jgi:hypothetical protein
MAAALEYDEEWGDRLQREHDEYIDLLEGALEDEEDAETITGQPFCGCETCYRRESWTYIILHALHAYRAEELRLIDLPDQPR